MSACHSISDLIADVPISQLSATSDSRTAAKMLSIRSPRRRGRSASAGAAADEGDELAPFMYSPQAEHNTLLHCRKTRVGQNSILVHPTSAMGHKRKSLPRVF